MTADGKSLTYRFDFLGKSADLCFPAGFRAMITDPFPWRFCFRLSRSPCKTQEAQRGTDCVAKNLEPSGRSSEYLYLR